MPFDFSTGALIFADAIATGALLTIGALFIGAAWVTQRQSIAVAAIVGLLITAIWLTTALLIRSLAVG